MGKYDLTYQQLLEERNRLIEQNRALALGMQRRNSHGYRIEYLQKQLAEKNKLLSDMHYIWCGAACTGSHRGDYPVTEDVVRLGEQQIARLRSYYERHVKGASVEEAQEEE